jgi:tetratricopeptide (TPR) repeat protein
MGSRVCRAFTVLASALVAVIFFMLVAAPTGASPRAAGFPLANAPSRPVSPQTAIEPLSRLLLTARTRLAPDTPPGSFPFTTTASSDGLIVVHTYGASATFPADLIALAQRDLQTTVHQTLDLSLKRPVQIYAYRSRDDFLTGAPVTNPAETGALTDALTNSIYLVSTRTGDDGAVRSLPHELTHIVFHQNMAAGHLEQVYFDLFPLWLDEGLAAYDEPDGGAYTSGYNESLDKAVSAKRLTDFLRQFAVDYPSDPDTDLLDYAEARSFITYLVTSYGLPRFHQFLQDAKDGDLILAAEQNFGADLVQLQSRWEVSLGLAPTVKDAGYAPAGTALAPFTPGALPARANSTAPLALDMRDVISVPSLLLLGVLLALALAGLTQEWLGTRRRGRLLYGEWSAAQAPSSADGPASTADAPMLESATVLPANVLVLAPPAPSRLTRSGPRWYDLALILLPVPLALAAGLIVFQRDPLHALRIPYLVAASVAAPFALALLALTLLRRRRDGFPSSRLMSLTVAALACALPLLQATPTAHAEAATYESRGAYALALTYYTAAGESHTAEIADLARVQGEWASAAAGARDFATATSHFRAAIALDPADHTAADDQARLLDTTERWGQALTGARQFDAALAVYADQLASPTCDAACHARLHADTGDTYLAWANTRISSGDLSGALTTLSTLAQRYGDTPAGAHGGPAAKEIAAARDYLAALGAGAHGDDAGMNAQLQQVVSQHPGTAAADLAARTPEPVSGVVRDVSGAPVDGDRLYFLAFTSQTGAESFRYDFRSDTSVFKVRTVIGGGGAFSVRLPPNYWYIPAWDDTSQVANNYFNAPISDSNDAFTVQAVTPGSAGVIVGF